MSVKKESSNIPEDILYPKELNKHLLQQIKSLTSENGDLRNFIIERDTKIEELSKTITSLQENIKDVVSVGGPGISTKSAGVISAKVTELCKNNRHLVAELESIKTKCAGLERKLLESESKLSLKPEIQIFEKGPPVPPNQDELKDLRDRLANVTKKLFESRNKQEQMKNELLLANRCLQNEIGPGFTSILKLSTDPIGCKGRMQEIIILRNRVAELEEKLFGKDKSILTDIKKENTNQVIRDIEIKRRSQIDKTAKDFEVLQREYADLKKKMEGGMARIKNLTSEGITLRQTIQNLSDKSNHDEKIKDELILQQKAVEKQYQELLKNLTISNEKIKNSHEMIAKDLKNEQFRVNALTDKLEEKTKKIEYLKNQIENVIESSLQKVYFTPLQIAADNEIKVLSDLLHKTNIRLDEERKKNMELERRFLKMKENKMTNKIYTDMEIKELAVSGRKTRSVTSMIGTRRITTLQYTSKNGVSKNEAVGNIYPNSWNRFEIEVLKNKLEINEEQIKFLETQLRIIGEERTAAFEAIDEMIVNSKKIFAKALKQFKEAQ